MHAQTRWWAALLVGWGIAIGAGSLWLWRYKTTPGALAEAPASFPLDTPLTRTAGRPTLILAGHPQCPCTQATISELARVLAVDGNRADTFVLMVRPDGAEEGFERTSSWERASRIPGVRVLLDDKGAIASRFHALTSGQMLFYDAQGALRFSGGITSARGHEGENDGARALQDLLLRGHADITAAPVFGCPLFDDTPATIERSPS